MFAPLLTLLTIVSLFVPFLSVAIQPEEGVTLNQMLQFVPGDHVLGLLAAAWLVLQELNCPVRWLVRDPAQLQAGEDLSQANFPVLAARDQLTLSTFKPWADALVSSS